MSQHDYVIANGTGAAVRSDLNNALAAIVSKNSGASAPSTTYAYQWWADTTAGLLKLRNAANSAWVTIGSLSTTGFGLLAGGDTLTAALGSASTPGITFTGDLNTGIYSPGADQVAISTGGTGRLFVSSSGRVGIGTASPNNTVSVYGTSVDTVPILALLSGNDQATFNDGAQIAFGYNGTNTYQHFVHTRHATAAENNAIDFYVCDGTSSNTVTSGSARAMSLLGSGRLLVGTATANTSGAKLQTVDGITFPATQVASADPNTLDDYEEGTWTPAIAGTTLAGAGTYSVQVGRYTKIGNTVTAHFNLTWSAHTGTGNMLISGLPFTSANVTNLNPAAVAYANNLTITGISVILVTANATTGTINSVNNGAAAALAIDTAATLITTITYQTA